MTRHDVTLTRYSVEQAEEWLKWGQRMPFIQFPADWQVCPIPAFAGAMVRFRVKLPDGRGKSVYFDAFDRLGFYGAPYWEVYPVRGDAGRCDMGDVAQLLELIAAPDEEASNG